MYTLLIADDEHLEREAIDLLVKRSTLQFTTIKVRNGRQAVEAVQKTHVDIAFLDIRMPGLSGLEAAKRINEIAPDCRIVFLTAWNSFDFAQEAIRLGAKDYLVKPASPHDVITLLTRLKQELDQRGTTGTYSSTEEVRTILRQFSRSFFAALKYGVVGDEGIRTYLRLEGIEMNTGIALVVDGIEEQRLASILEKSVQGPRYEACCFPTVDRISVLMFALDPEALALAIKAEHLLLQCPQCHVGMGTPFSTYGGIPKSLREASQAYGIASSGKQTLVKFESLVGYALLDDEIDKTERQLIDAVLSSNQGDARRLAHLLQDRIALTHTEQEAFLDRYYETVLVVTRAVRNGIDHFSYEPLQKTSPMELERYFMDFIDSACEVIGMDRKDKYLRLFKDVKEYINSHYAEPLSLERLSEMYGLSPGYFSRLFKEYVGESFVDHLTSCRLNVAKQMIRTGMKIREAAEVTGFSDYSYFSRVFRNSVGLSPRDFQKKLK
jgi:two-component system response regulator YesN